MSVQFSGIEVHRRTKEYKDTGMELMENWDLIAGYLLKLMGTYSISHYADGQEKSPETIQKADPWIAYDCVAVTFDENNNFFAAANSHRLTDKHVRAAKKALGFWYFSYQVVTEGDKDKMHAEMQLLRFLKRRNITPKFHYIGVSKPCCSQCKQELDAYKIKYSTYHGDEVINWQAP